jgi:hypothetical protein
MSYKRLKLKDLFYSRKHYAHTHKLLWTTTICFSCCCMNLETREEKERKEKVIGAILGVWRWQMLPWKKELDETILSAPKKTIIESRRTPSVSSQPWWSPHMLVLETHIQVNFFIPPNSFMPFQFSNIFNPFLLFGP